MLVTISVHTPNLHVAFLSIVQLCSRSEAELSFAPVRNQVQEFGIIGTLSPVWGGGGCCVCCFHVLAGKGDFKAVHWLQVPKVGLLIWA